MTHSVLYVAENTHVVEVVDLRDHLGAVQTDATVQLTALTDTSGATVSGITLPVTLLHVANGLYRAVVPHTLGVQAERRYWATIKAVGSQGFRAQWRETLVAKVRSE